MNMKDKKEYIAPVLTVVTFKTERGYAVSTVSLFHLQEGEDLFNEQSQENWTEEGNLFGSVGW